MTDKPFDSFYLFTVCVRLKTTYEHVSQYYFVRFLTTFDSLSVVWLDNLKNNVDSFKNACLTN